MNRRTRQRNRVRRLVGSCWAMVVLTTACDSGGTEVVTPTLREPPPTAPEVTAGAPPSDVVTVPTTSEPSTWMVDTQNCSDPVAANSEIAGILTIGSVAPQSGGLVSVIYAPLVLGFQAYIDKANADRLLGDVSMNVVVADDQGQPTLTALAVSGLIEANADVISGILGSTNNLAARGFVNQNCVPQLMGLAASARLGDVRNAPWTMGGVVPDTVETTVFANSILRASGTGARVAMLVTSDDDTLNFADAFVTAANENGLEVVDQKEVEPNVIDPPTEQLVAIAAREPDALVVSLAGAACATFLTELAKTKAAIGTWQPAVYMASGCAYPSILSLAGDAADGVLSSTNLVTDDPTFQAAMQAKDITTDFALAAEGWTAAEVTVAILMQAQRSVDGLTRASIMNAARNLDFTPSLALPGVHYVTNGAEDAFPAESLQVIRFDAATKSFVAQGPLIAQFES